MLPSLGGRWRSFNAHKSQLTSLQPQENAKPLTPLALIERISDTARCACFREYDDRALPVRIDQRVHRGDLKVSRP
jgi:hypothetical protein